MDLSFRPRRRSVDVLVVTLGTTLGLQNFDRQVVAALGHLGLTHELAPARVALLHRIPIGPPLEDWWEALATSLAVEIACLRVAPRLILYPTSLTTILAPACRLSRSFVRFDALASENRRGPAHLVQRRLEGRSLRRAAALLPLSLRIGADRRSLMPRDATIIQLPPVIDRTPAPQQRAQTLLCYVGNPDKKGLDLIVRAWARIPHGGHQLLIAGVDQRQGLRFLARRGIAAPSDASWLGRLDRASYLDTLLQADLYVNASRFEDFGAAQLEALGAGALLITVPTRGPAECVEIVREIAPDLVAGAIDDDALATVMRTAMEMSPDRRDALRHEFRCSVEAYSDEAFRRRFAAAMRGAGL